MQVGGGKIVNIGFRFSDIGLLKLETKPTVWLRVLEAVAFNVLGCHFASRSKSVTNFLLTDKSASWQMMSLFGINLKPNADPRQHIFPIKTISVKNI